MKKYVLIYDAPPTSVCSQWQKEYFETEHELQEKAKVTALECEIIFSGLIVKEFEYVPKETITEYQPQEKQL